MHTQTGALQSERSGHVFNYEKEQFLRLRRTRRQCRGGGEGGVERGEEGLWETLVKFLFF